MTPPPITREHAQPPNPAGAVVAAAAVTLIGSVVLAPLAIGELKIGHAPEVFLVLSLFGLDFAAIGTGIALGRNRVHSRRE